MRWQDVAKLLTVLLLVSVGVTYGDLFGGLFQLTGMNYTHTGDITCGDTCDSYINVTTSYWRVCFEHTADEQMMYIEGDPNLQRVMYSDYPDTVLYKKSTYGRTLWVNLKNVDNVVTTQPRVEVDWLVPTYGAGNWRPLEDGDCWDRGKVNKIKLVGHKNPTQNVKWSFVMDEYVDIDPIWNGVDSSTSLEMCLGFEDDVTSATGGNNGVNYGVTFDTGFIGKAAYFTGNDTNSHIEIFDNSSDPFDGLDAFTILVWAKPEDVWTTSGGYEDSATLAEMSDIFNFRLSSRYNNNIRATVNAATAKNTYAADNTAIWNEWGLYALMWERNNLSLWFNGTMLTWEDNDDTAATTNDYVRNMFIGNRGDNATNRFAGYMDEFAFYSRTLSPAEHLAYYNAEANCTEIATATPVSDSDTNITIWNGTAWVDYTGDTEYLSFRCTPTQQDCEPLNQDVGSSQSIFQICNAGTENSSGVYMRVNQTITNIDLKCDDDYTVAGSIVLTTANQTIHGALNVDACIDVSCWADYFNPTSGGYLDVYASLGFDSPPEPLTGIFFSNDGSDTTGDGSEENPYQTITKLNTISLDPGDIVRFKGGDTWYLPQDAYPALRYSGSSGNYIHYTNYGTGLPEFNGAYLADDTSQWTEYSTNIWRFTEDIGETQTIESNQQIGNVIFNDGESYGVMEIYSIGNLNTQGEYFFDEDPDPRDGGELYLYSVGNPATYYTKVELALNEVIFDLSYSWAKRSYIEVSNIAMKNTAGHAVYCNYASNNMLIHDNEIGVVGGGQWAADPTARWGNGVEIYSYCDDVAVYNNIIWDVWDAALTVQTDASTGLNTNISFYNNIVYDSSYCWEYFENGASTVTTDIVFDHNTCYNIGTQWGVEQRDDTSGPKCWRFGSQRGTATGINVTNNICDYNDTHSNSNYYFTRMTDWVGIGNLTLDYNYYNGDDNPPIISWLSSYNTLAAFTAARGFETNGLEQAVTFTDATNHNFTPVFGDDACTADSDGSYIGALPCATS